MISDRQARTRGSQSEVVGGGVPGARISPILMPNVAEMRDPEVLGKVVVSCVAVLVWRHACIPPGTDSACSGHPFPSKKLGFAARTQGACSQRRCGESPHAKLQRVSSEDCRTPDRGQATSRSVVTESIDGSLAVF